ncbi:hypothetical protein [Amycolatopsis sp. H20-H5]|uniref:hypothetical protein n=1 Tax=Amycolatopsis sp. H20-H5 TaxID=3046309 RepID=UPI002DB7DF6C|nr:hypothetical protein [Amycolatopsis sp. H20-H5]MEC3975679.1 hypothetical protein [Amycolatopsis sp. H20-H5]
MSLADPLGAASQALPSLNPGERLLWAAYGRVFNYDIRGLDALGQPEKGMLRKLGGGAAGVAGGFVDGVLGGGADSGTDRPLPPQVIAFGDRPGVAAHEFLRELGPVGHPRRVWALTTERLVVLGVVPPPEVVEPASFLAKAVGFGKGLAKTGKGIVEIIADRTKTYGENREGEPATAHEMTVRAELPRAGIGGFALAQRKKRKPCLRLSLVDGSGFDLLFDVEDPALFAWLLDRTNGSSR